MLLLKNIIEIRKYSNVLLFIKFFNFKKNSYGCKFFDQSKNLVRKIFNNIIIKNIILTFHQIKYYQYTNEK